jgi:hypothetical protein
MHHDDYITKQRLNAVKAASDVIEGKQSILLAARSIVQLRFDLGIDENDDDLLTFVGIDSETDHLPLGSERQHWDQNALLSKDKEIQEMENWALSFGVEACKRLISKLS